MPSSLAWLLRHGALKQGLVMCSDGFVVVVEALQIPALHHWPTTVSEIHALVQHDEERRCKLAMFQDQFMIRCVQGHSIS